MSIKQNHIDNYFSSVKNIVQSLKRSLLINMISAAFALTTMFAFPGDAHAARYGGRVGGKPVV